MDRYLILYYHDAWDGFIVDGSSYTFIKYLKSRISNIFPFNLDAGFDEMHDSEYPLCIISGCKEHWLNDDYSSKFYTLRKKVRTCICNKSQWYTVRQNSLDVVNLKRYVIYVYDCASSELSTCKRAYE